ncbi:hypothetical protein JTE90_018555 [Oedothorax gibbosus]|uniref:c-SKI SMAD4-binding domain-containing protein n=1 Tax=Oedothorax gibbosus TaxID=931172 RepID=A0AAV6U4P7_9ARAC|nr:hypothetical protein JTE90_018555 [Oedothorax gibbosus]
MEESGGGPSKRLMYTPHLKKVLKSYQASATKSLHGPNSVMGVWQGGSESDASVSPPNPSLIEGPSSSSAASSKKPKPGPSSQPQQEYDPFVAPPPFPIQQPPIFTPADQTGWEKSETVLEGETIACFSVGGEERLCLPQILNTVLRDYSLHQINYVCDTLHIYCSRCNPSQLEVLKASGILPFNAPSCGLITKTDAQRLCAALLDASPPLIVTRTKDAMKQPPFQVRVYHECFGRCEGLYTPDLFQHPLAPCIECLECHALLCPQKFVCHVHPPKETRTCHWGFDVLRWRAYVLLAVDLEEEVPFQQALLEMKERFGAKYKRKQILEESCYPSQKRVRADNCFTYPMGMDPMLVYYYSQPHLWENAFQAYPSVITKDGKTLYIPPESFPQLIQKSMHSLRNRLALNPANVQKLMPMKIPEDSTIFAYHAQKAETLSKRPLIKKDPDHDSISCFDSEDAYSDTSFSTLSAGTEDGLVSNLDDEDDLQPSPEAELLELNKVLGEVEDASLRAKILSEVEALVAKYRKCLSVAVQGKKLYQMELEKIHYTQRAKLHKLRGKNKNLEREVNRLKSNASETATSTSTEQSKRSQNMRTSPSPQQHSPSPPPNEKDISVADISQIEMDTHPPEEEVVTTPLDEDLEPDIKSEEDEDSICSSPIQPKLQDEPLGK